MQNLWRKWCVVDADPDLEDRVRSQNNFMGDWNVFFTFKEKIMFKSHLIKSNHRVLGKNKVDTYGAPILHVIIAPIF